MGDVGTAISSLPRAAILRAADSPRLQRLVQTARHALGAARFVAGETLDECVAVLRRLERRRAAREHDAPRRGDPRRRRARAAVTAEYEAIVDRLVAEELRANVALKLTHLGLVLRRGDRVRERRAPRRARGRARHVRPHRHGAVDVRRRRRCGSTSASATPGTTASASCSRRTSTARPTTSSACSRSRRTCASSRARTSSPRRSRTRRSATSTARTSSSSSAACAAARTSRSRRTTSAIIRTCRRSPSARASAATASSSRCSTACGPALQRALAAEGYKVLVATPFGPDWYPYLMRRLAERPANLGFFLRNLVRR